MKNKKYEPQRLAPNVPAPTSSARKNTPTRKRPAPASRRGPFKRPPLGRVRKIYDLLLANSFPNCNTIAATLEVSRNTVQRDIEFMRLTFDWPIEYDDIRHGYYFSKPVDGFPGVSVTESELFALLVAHKAIEQYHGTPFQRPLEMAFQKLLGRLDGEERYTLENLDQALSFRPFAPEDADLRIFQTVSRAMNERVALKFAYRKPAAKSAEQRHVHPYHLACINNVWYLLAHDPSRPTDVRTFALSRISSPVVTDQRFLKPKNFNPDTVFSKSFSVMSGDADYEIVIEFDAWATDLMHGRVWHSSQKITELPGGGSHFQCRLNGLDEIERWILSWGTHATVIRPQQLADRIGHIVRELGNRYPSR